MGMRTAHSKVDALAHHNERDTMKRVRIAGVGITGLLLLTLTACNNTDNLTTSAVDSDEERFHEKSFSWAEASGPLAKSSAVKALAGKTTTFASGEELKAAVEALVAQLDDKDFTDSLWKPVDYACDELDLALWNTYGTIRVADSVVFDENIMRGRCRNSEEIGMIDSSAFSSVDALGKSSKWKWWNESEVVDRQFPYKMIGRSWDNFDLWAYKSTGGETQFEKRRSRFGITSWWDTDASRIGVRIYLYDCGNVGLQKICYFRTHWNSWYKNDDYVSKRDFAVGEIKWNSNNYPVIRPAKLAGSDAVLSMHSVDHNGLQFRAYSTSGLTNAVADDLIFPEYVTW